MSTKLLTLIGMLFMLTTQADAAAPSPSKWNLDLWPQETQDQLTKFLDTASLEKTAPYAVFDADNTLWQNDLEEALMPYLEQKEILSLSKLDPAIQPIPILKQESLWNYYLRLCEIDDSVCYLWIAQVFSGLELSVLQENIHEMLGSEEPIKTTYFKNGALQEVEVGRPKVFAAQAQLIQALHKAGVKVWVVSAALEELVRMVASNPKFGLNVVPEQVIGVNLLLNNPDGSVRLSSHDRQQLAGLDAFLNPERLKAKLSYHLVAPATWYEGKVAGIRKWIEPIQAPILVAGDSKNDLPMLFEADTVNGGLRIWVNRKASYYEKASSDAKLRGEEFTSDYGWLIMKPSALHGPTK
jgi:phosphoserine phosphatase